MPIMDEQDKKILRSVNLFQDLNARDLEELEHHAVLLTLSSGETLIAEGEKGDGLYVVLTGKLEIYTHNTAGERIALAFALPGSIVGEDIYAMGEDKRRTATVVAIENVRVAKIADTFILQLIEKLPKIKEKISTSRYMHAYERMLKIMTFLREVHITPEEVNYLHEEQYPKGTKIISQGDEGDAAYFILEGEVSVHRRDDDGEKIIGKISAGQIFGELALLEKQKRWASIIAEKPVRLLKIDRALFHKWHETHPIFQDLLKTLRYVYALPGEYMMSVHEGDYGGKPSISTVRHQADGIKYILTKIVNEDTVIFYKVTNTADAIERINYQSYDKDQQRELQILNGQLVGLMALGPWPRLNQMIENVYSGAKISPSMKELFHLTGDIRLEEASELMSDQSLACQCMQVSFANIAKTIAQYGASMDQIIAHTGATLGCGACKATIEEMLHKTNFINVMIHDKKQIGKNVWSIQLKAISGTLPAYLPGQYTVLRAKLDYGKDWVQSSYILTAQPDEKTWEIMVLRQPVGLFSNWITGQHHSNVLLQASMPRGTFLPPPSAKNIIFIAEGIAVVNAITMYRAHTPGLVLCYIETNEEDFLLKDELQSYNNVFFHSTSKDGYLTPERVKTLLAPYPQVDIMICGTAAFCNMVNRILRTLNINESYIQTESFSISKQVRKEKKPAKICPIFAKDTTDEVAQLLNEIYTKFLLYDYYKSRLKTIKAEIAEKGSFVPTTDELELGCKYALERQGIDVQHSYILDRRDVTDGDELKEMLREHDYLVESSGSTIILTFVNQKAEIPEKYSLLEFQLTPYCKAKALFYAQESANIPNPLIYTPPPPLKLDPIPLAKPFHQDIPVIGTIFRYLDVITRPVELVVKCQEMYGKTFNIHLPFVFDLVYGGREIAHQILELPRQIGQIGKLILNVPTIGYWFPRTQPNSPEWLQALIVSCRRFTATNQVNPEKMAAMPDLVQGVIKRHAAKWGEEIDLSTTLVTMIFDASLTCLMGGKLWEDLREEGGIEMFRTIANGADIPRAAWAKMPYFNRYLAEARATQKLIKVVDKLLAAHRATGCYPFFDQIASMEVNGGPLPPEDIPWAFVYLTWNGVNYPGSYVMWCLAHILSHPKIYKALRDSDEATRETIATNCFIETVRLNPVSSLVRVLNCPIHYETDNKSYVVPENDYFGTLTYGVCHDPNLYTDPEAFNPYRYSTEKVPDIWGKGQFKCIAQHFMRLITTTIVLQLIDRFDFELLDPLPPRICRVALLYPTTPIRVKLKARQKVTEPA